MLDHSVIGSLITGGIALLAFAAGYGSVTARLQALERQMEHSVTRDEFKALERQMGNVVTEIQGLRGEIIGVLKGSGRLA